MLAITVEEHLLCYMVKGHLCARGENDVCFNTHSHADTETETLMVSGLNACAAVLRELPSHWITVDTASHWTRSAEHVAGKTFFNLH